MRLFLFILMIPTMLQCTGSDSVINTQPQETAAENLHYVVREPNDMIGQAPVLILLHGYGSNEEDLFSLADQVPAHWLVVSMRAPIAISENKYKWYDVKMVDGKITLNADDEARSRKALITSIDSLVKKYKADEHRVVVAGFSQGANMSLALALTEPAKVHAAACFSGRFLEEVKPLIASKEDLESTQVFIAHGTKDSMLPISYAYENRAQVESLGIKVSFSSDENAHSISSKQLNAFIDWLTNL